MWNSEIQRLSDFFIDLLKENIQKWSPKLYCFSNFPGEYYHFLCLGTLDLIQLLGHLYLNLLVIFGHLIKSPLPDCKLLNNNPHIILH